MLCYTLSWEEAEAMSLGQSLRLHSTRWYASVPECGLRQGNTQALHPPTAVRAGVCNKAPI